MFSHDDEDEDKKPLKMFVICFTYGCTLNDLVLQRKAAVSSISTVINILQKDWCSAD